MPRVGCEDRRRGRARQPRLARAARARPPVRPGERPRRALRPRGGPGPFRARTVELGGYRGICHDGRLVAMVGRRMRLPGFTEISAVCTDPDLRGRGLARALVGEVAAGITTRGEQAFLHASSDNVGAIRLYESLGFTVRRTFEFVAALSPGS